MPGSKPGPEMLIWQTIFFLQTAILVVVMHSCSAPCFLIILRRMCLWCNSLGHCLCFLVADCIFFIFKTAIIRVAVFTKSQGCQLVVTGPESIILLLDLPEKVSSHRPLSTEVSIFILKAHDRRIFGFRRGSKMCMLGRRCFRESLLSRMACLL